jgi:hypothetical protein
MQDRYNFLEREEDCDMVSLCLDPSGTRGGGRGGIRRV